MFPRLLYGLLLTMIVGAAQARQIADAGEGLTIEGQPQRVVVLEYSFLDAVVLAGLSPVGIADDNNPARILPALRERLADYRSVGLRSQPSLELIASLQPDLIIADLNRHQAVYPALQQIAPTLLLPSRGIEYSTVLDELLTIGQALGREAQLQARLAEHERIMDRYRETLARDESLLFAVAGAGGMTVHGPKAFASGVMRRLGLRTATPEQAEQAYIKVSFEQFAYLNPDWLLLGDYQAAQGGAEFFLRWQRHPLWSHLSAVDKRQLRRVSPYSWSLARGLLGAEQIAADLQEQLR
ncbi:ABC transporter substrate-binding protein [Marinobacterium arenosum]|uniref:ABC transporter substrate-binding protein n=1 Tax=Marinobacterium arenosum TaxID=2862496 RepID=UPI001C940A99|nr:Fe(3+) dicitrate ABC transporter substrate-binding protein [Marinobacterium arenosum]MBY4677356.1 ABC transporter substrate-binding protein [Marinobacterium arenosum]